ncbi:PspC domain-containing protein [Mangrovibacillus sp. Mu-81]|uniref:PspC domain-containing protein n=1 Tax=Mangrovibacillus sp. Mu-81 TaxID=3121478 RepID=UPI002FE4D046
MNINKKLRKSTADKSISGVCGGIAEYFGVSSFMVRILFIILPANILIYIILANTLPDPPPSL